MCRRSLEPTLGQSATGMRPPDNSLYTKFPANVKKNCLMIRYDPVADKLENEDEEPSVESEHSNLSP